MAADRNSSVADADTWRRPLLPWEESATAELFQLLSGISPNREIEDSWIWMLDLVRGYTVKPGYSLQQDAQNAAANNDFSHAIS